jgi:hypothetical protein
VRRRARAVRDDDDAGHDGEQIEKHRR